MSVMKADVSRLDTASPIPLYYQLQEILRGRIREGIYKTGEMIPTEKELQEEFQVSRITVRNAINGLVFEDLLVKKQGQGTFVARKMLVEDFSRLRSFTERMVDQGMSRDAIRNKVIHARRIQASPRICEHLNLQEGEDVIYVKRVRLIEDEPIEVFESYLAVGAGVNENFDFSGSIYHILEQELGLVIIGAEKTIEASFAQKETAELLGVREGDPTLIIRHTTFLEGEVPVEYAEGIYRADRYKYVVRLKR